MLGRVANFLNKTLPHASRFLNTIGVITLVAMMIVIVVGVCTRRFFDLPIRGMRDITILGFSIVVFLPMALCTLKGGHVSVDAFTNKFSKPLRARVEAIILFITTATLGLLTWQLFVLALRTQAMGQTTKVLAIPMYPFLYLATLGILMMALVYFANLLVSVSSLVRRK